MHEEATNAFAAVPGPNANFQSLPQPYPAEEYGAVLAMTDRLFPGRVDVRHELDPEIAGHYYLDFNVVAHGTLDDIMARDVQWHQELGRVAPRSLGAYCLNIDIQE